MDKEVLLAIINSPVSGLAVMVVALIAAGVAMYGIKAAGMADFNEGKAAARKEGLENLQVTLAKLVHDQSEMKQNVSHGPSHRSQPPLDTP